MNAKSQRLTPRAWRSFRDPDGCVTLALNDPILRTLTPSGLQKSREIAALETVHRFQDEGRWIEAEPSKNASNLLIHPRIFFPSYPHEWPATMLHRAGALTLQINRDLLKEGWELKDATPTNVLFEGTRPVFVDFLSPVKREPGQLGWRAYGQFARTFLIPMLLHRKCRIPLRWMFLAHRDGIPPAMALSMLGLANRFHPSAFGLVTLPAWLGERAFRGTTPDTTKGPSEDVATTITSRILRGLGHRLEQLRPVPPKTSTWFDYQDQGISYTPEGLIAKETFIAEALATYHPTTVLDLGCNTGKFSKMAAKAGARVIALDSDPECVNRLFLEAESEGLDIQPILADLGRPSPRLGWNYQEEYGLMDRLVNRFDMTFALALVHHLLVRERVPMEGIASFLAHTTRRAAVIEWVPPEDPQFRFLAGQNFTLYSFLRLDQFLAALEPWFELNATLKLPDSGRVLLWVTRR